MANVSSSNGLEKRPKLRFPGFDEPWRCSALSKLFDYERPDKYIVSSENYTSDGTIPVLTANQSFILGYTNETDGIYKKGEVIVFDDFTCDMKYANFPFKVKSSAIKLLTTRDSMPVYFGYNLLRHINYKPMGHARHWISVLQSYMTSIPSLSEQQKISIFLKLVDQRIDFQAKYIDALKKYKRGLSDELFGKKETTEEWTTVPFSEAFELLQNNTFSRDEMSSESGIAYNIHYGDVLIKYGVVVDLSKSNVPYIRSDVSLSKFAQSSYLRNGDIVIADTAEDYTVGKAVEIVGVADTKALSGLHTIPCRPKISFAPMYLGYFINSKRFRTQILPLVQGTKVSSISKSEIQKTSIAFPSFEVQSQIASMLYALDYRIDICQACVQGLVRTKEALLQQLFI